MDYDKKITASFPSEICIADEASDQRERPPKAVLFALPRGWSISEPRCGSCAISDQRERKRKLSERKLESGAARSRPEIRAEKKEGDATARFKMIANAGSVMELEDERVAIDVDGVFTHARSGDVAASVPILYGHNFAQGVGHSDKITAEDGKLIVEGVVSRKTQYADDFVASARLGFPWQASVGGYIREAIELREGESLELHGREIEGPAIIATKFELFEVSVVEYGADSETFSGVVAAASVNVAKNDSASLLPSEQELGLKGGKLMSQDEQVRATAERLGSQSALTARLANEPESRCDSADEITLNNEDARKTQMGQEQFDLNAYRQAQAEETRRVAEIRSRSMGADEELQAQAIEEGWTPDKFELESLRQIRGKAPAVSARDDKTDEKALEVAAIRAAGFAVNEKRYTDRQLSAADSLGSISFLEFCERAVGAPVYSFRSEPYKKVRAAITTQNLGSVLTNAANAILLQAFDYADDSWRKAFKISSVPDYKVAERWRVDTNFKFKEVPEGAEMEHAEIADEKYTIQAKTWGRQFALSEQAIVNGDALGVFADLLRQIAFGANEALCEECWGLFMNPATCSDSKAFYHADHGSLKTSCALTLDNLSAARAAFISRPKAKSATPLGVPPQLLIVPTALEDKALMLTKATTLNNGSTTDTPADFNPNRGRFQVVGVPFLGYSTFAGYSDTSWYLAADPNRLAAFEIAFLNGRQAPVIRQDQMRIGTLGIEFDAHCSWGVAQEDFRGILKATA